MLACKHASGVDSKMCVLLIFVATVCLVLSLLAHGSTFVGVNPTRQFPGVLWLHVVILGLCIAAGLVVGTQGKGSSEHDLWRWARRYSPPWLCNLVVVFFFYAIFNFFFTLFCLLEGGVPQRIKGELVLANHGKVIRKLTPSEYEQHEAYVIRTFSGHWMLFSSGSLVVLIASHRYRRATRAGRPGTELGEAEDLAGRASLPHAVSDRSSALE